MKSVLLPVAIILDIIGAALFAWGIASGVEAGALGLPLALPAAFILSGATLRAVHLWMVNWISLKTAQAGSRTLRNSLWPALLGERLPHAVIRVINSGERASFGIDHILAIEERAARFDPARKQAALGPVLVAAIVACASWVAALIMIATLIPFVLGMIIAGSAARRASDRQLAALGALSGLFVDRIANLALIRHYGAEERIARQVADTSRDVAARTTSVLRAAFLSGAVLEFFSALSVALVAVYCGFSLLGLLPFDPPEQLGLASAFFALAMAPEFYLPMRRLAAAYHEKQLGDAAEGALAEFAPEKPRPIAPAPAAAACGLQVEQATIEFSDRIIGPVSFALNAHDLVALTGPTGSGKTSILAALAGQLPLASGSVSTSIGEPVSPDGVAWAAQRPLLIPGTLLENLCLANPSADRERVSVVARMVGLDIMIDRRGGLDLMVDHHGSGLSGGERRRIGLARAILSDRPIIFCDEPTADLDAGSAGEITSLLQVLAQSHAVLVATHDPALIALSRTEVQI